MCEMESDATSFHDLRYCTQTGIDETILRLKAVRPLTSRDIRNFGEPMNLQKMVCDAIDD